MKLTVLDIGLLVEELKRDEVLRLRPYKDSVGTLTIGYGHNLENGISEIEAETLLRADIDIAIAELDRALPWWCDLPRSTTRALVNMCFQLWIVRLLGFKKMLAALERRELRTAADEVLESKLARQTPNRARRVAALIREQ